MSRYLLLLSMLLGAPAAIPAAAPTENPARKDEILVIGAPYGYRTPTSQSATRTATPIEEIPQSISIITRKLIEDQQPMSIAEALRNVSGIVTSNTRLTPAFDNTRIRGFAAEQFVDGFTQYYNPGDRDSLVNVERIEVLKGTNGLLYGGGSGSPVGGLINIVSKSPQPDAAVTLGAKGGTYSFLQGSLDVNQPVNDRVFLRVTGEYTRSDSDVDVVENTRYNATAALLATNDVNTTVTLRLRTSRWEGQDYQGLPAAGTIFGNILIEPDLFVGPQDIADSQSGFDGLEARLEQVFNAMWSGSLQGRIASSSFEEIAQLISGEGFDFGADLPVVGPPAVAESLGLGQLPFALFNAHLYQEQDETSVVGNAIARFNRGKTRHTLLLGADYSRYEDQGYINAALSSSPFVDLASPVWSTPWVEPGTGEIDNFVANIVYGAYLQWQLSLAERLHLLGGVRRAKVEIDYTGPGNRDETAKAKWIPRAGAVLDISNSLSVFAAYSKGIRGQPFADFVTTPEPEESTQAEVGLRFNIGEALTGQIAAFTIDRINVAVPTPNPEEDGGFGSVPEGEQSSEGFEVEVVWQVFDSLRLLGSYSYIKTSYNDDLFAFVDQGGQALPGVPTNSGRFWANYDFSGGPADGFQVGAGVYAQDKTLISLRNNFYSDAYFTVDSSISYTFSSVLLELAIKNLTDEKYFERLNYLGGRVAPAAGRAVYLGARVSF